MARGGDRWFTYVLADRLHKTAHEIEGLSLREIEEWKAYLGLEADRAAMAEKMAKQKRGVT
jgi:hypothetical protein